MKNLIAAFPDNLLEALEIAKTLRLNNPKRDCRNIVICGMGGSGIGGKIVSQWLQEELTIPVVLCQDYHLPHFVSKESLVIASSYSGNTEETLLSVDKASKVGATIFGITSGGKLQQFCLDNKYDHIVVPGGNPPRTALAFSLVQLVNYFVQLSMASSTRLLELKKAQEMLVSDKEEILKEAKRLAELIGERTPVFYAVSRYEGVAVRAKQQFNENAKVLCWMHTIPEMNHNELVGWGGGDNRFAAVFLDSSDSIERNERRIEISLDKVKSKTDKVGVFKAKGGSIIEKSLYLINLVDWASLLHSEIYSVDAMEIDIIDYLKAELGKI
jgi:glucose/mannose-6-phosphate isomerase